ncbi:MAG: anion permease [Melioribacteraceae bacterium]|nr:anion permease [Melioribacteraceae bacterium]
MIEKNIKIDKKEFDPLDLNNYKIEKLPTREKSKFEKGMALVGGPLAVFVFILFAFLLELPFLQNISPEQLSSSAKDEYNNSKSVVKLNSIEDFSDSQKEAYTNITNQLGNRNGKKKEIDENTLSENEQQVWRKMKDNALSKRNAFMLAIFLAALVLWISEAIPAYLTSLILIAALVLTNVLRETDAYHQLGHKVMWLNILSFVLASMLVKTRVAKRFALWLILKFGKNASMVLISFILINVVLSAFISATTAKAAILLPIMMVIAATYGATGGSNRNNFGRNLILQNLFQINISAGGFITGSGANLLAGALIAGAIGIDDFLYSDWLFAAFPLAMITIAIGYFVGTKIMFRIPKEDRKPQILGGMERLREELDKMGKIGWDEIRAIIIFVAVLLMWSTDRYHGISKTAIVLVGAIVALLPGIGIMKWNNVDIPWHLLLFSAGAYTLGAGLKATDLASISVDALFDNLGLGAGTPFWLMYLLLTGTMVFSALFFQSKTMRTLIFIPIAIGVAQRFGFSILSLAFPVALLIEHVYALPFNSKPAALLYVTDHYSWTDTFRFGVTMLVIGWVLIIIWGETWLRFLGYTPNGVFGLF